MRNSFAIVAALSLFAGTSLAAAPLAPGKPAGLSKAQDYDHNTVLYIVGVGVIAAGIAIAASGGSDNHLATGGTIAGGGLNGGGVTGGSGGGTGGATSST